MSANGSDCNDFPHTSPFEMRGLGGNFEEDYDQQHFQINIESLLKQTEHFTKPFEPHHSTNNNTSTLSSNKHVAMPFSTPLSYCGTRRFTDYVTSSSNYNDDDEDNSFHNK